MVLGTVAQLYHVTRRKHTFGGWGGGDELNRGLRGKEKHRRE